MTETLKIVIPMAGWGTRMRPHTWSKPPKPVNEIGKTSLDHLMDMLATLPDPENTKFNLIIGPFWAKKSPCIAKNPPKLKTWYVVQGEMKRRLHAIWLARHEWDDPHTYDFLGYPA